MALITTFGAYVASSRKRLGLNQKQLAERVKRDGDSISAQYLNDIEHDRRTPTSELIREIASVLNLDSDYLHYLARKWPDDLVTGTHAPEQVRDLLLAFRTASK